MKYAIHLLFAAIIICYVPLGETLLISKLNFCGRMDQLVTSYAGPGTLVMGMNGIRQYGCFQKLRQDQHSQIEGKLSELVDWGSECRAAGLSAGSYLSIEGAGVGGYTFVAKRLGPFV